MAYKRLAHLVDHYKIHITTPEVSSSGSFLPTPYTLSYDGRTLKGRMNADGTITCLQALSGELVVAHTKDMPDHKRVKKALVNFLGKQYNEFLQAFQADEAEEMQYQFIEVRPDPKKLDVGGELPQRLLSDDLKFGMRVVYFDQIPVPKMYVGRVEEVKQTSLGEMATTGLIAEVVLLEADDHENMTDLFFREFLYRKSEPLMPDVYTWPSNLPSQTFKNPKRPGHLVTFEMRIQPFEITVLSSLDFTDNA